MEGKGLCHLEGNDVYELSYVGILSVTLVSFVVLSEARMLKSETGLHATISDSERSEE